MTYSYTLTQDLDWQRNANWQDPDTPFMSFEYWQALIDTGAIGSEAGWVPLYIVIHKMDSDRPIAVMPLFIKGHHQGEYVFDHAWAEAYARYGEDYYPRLVTSVPYTPVTGERFWLADGIELNSEIWQAAIAAIDNIAKQTGASSWHGLFVNERQEQVFNTLPNPIFEHQLLERQGCQFLWENKKLTSGDANVNLRHFRDFDDFLSTLTAKKRKNIRAERKKIPKQNLNCRIKVGRDITSADWEVFYQCYAMTYAIRGRPPYLKPEFFEHLALTMPENLMLAQAFEGNGEDNVKDNEEVDREEDGEDNGDDNDKGNNGKVVASSLFFYDDASKPNATLYGRYWGSLAEFDSLHFELCYYQGIEFTIAQGLQYFDPGTQGEHKLIRGFVPTKTYSLHRIYDERFEPAIANFCEQDRQYMQQYRQQAHKALPFNIDNMPEFKG